MPRKKEYDYFTKLYDLAEHSFQSAVLLNEITKKYQVRLVEKQLAEMHTIEHTADSDLHEMMQHLASEFITPIEREDIANLAQSIDQVTDSIEDVLITLHMYNINQLRPEQVKFTSLIVNSCMALKTIFQEFPNYKKSSLIKEKFIEVNKLEENGDTLYCKTVHNLFLNRKDPVDLFVWSDIFAKLERCSDACEHVANNVEHVIMKNS